MAGRRNYRLVSRNLISVVEAVVTGVDGILRQLGFVDPSESIWSTLRKVIEQDEL
jgi:hypothetical protein